MIISNKLRIGALLACSEANGPGRRFVIWMQGCEKACRKCINPQFQDIKGGYEISFEMLSKKIKRSIEQYNVNGITFSGGEPLYQAECLCTFVKQIKEEIELNIFMFTGYTYSELNEIQREVWDMCEMIVSGSYMYDQKGNTEKWLSSSNQKLSFDPRFEELEVFNRTPSEITIKEDGSIIVTGLIEDTQLIEQIKNSI